MMIQIQHVNKSFGKFNVLNDVNLSLQGGQCVALIGPNGSGKTTLIKSILGMVVPQSGKILFQGKDIHQQWKYRNEIGYMPQIGRYPDNMTIAQVFDMMTDIRKISAKHLDTSLMKDFAIEELFDKRMCTLSGGTRQKVSACLAFLFNPQVLILDEPTAGLDPLSTEILKQKIHVEKAKNKLIIISSHVLSELDDLVSQVIYMQDGTPKFHQSLEQLKAETGTTNLSKAIAQVMAQHEYTV